MEIASFPFKLLNWATVPVEEHAGETGMAYWQVQQMGNIRVRLVKYSPNYSADHWCKKGHVVYCLEGAMDTLLQDGRIMKLTAGTGYLVGDNSEAHRSASTDGCTIFVVD
jgi:hypothetical protein